MTQSLSDFVVVRGRYHRSVNLVADWDSKSSLDGFLPTDTILHLGAAIATQATTDGGSRVWSLTGPYGTGKSAFGVFLADALCSKKPRHASGAQLRLAAGLKSREFFPLLVTAERADLATLLRTKIRDGRRKLGGRSGQKAQSVVEELLSLAELASSRKHAGLLLVIDELGKFLEYAVMRPSGADVLLLQQLAEAVSRSPIPIVLLTILHSAFADYLPAGEDVRRAEWQKVQGRFQDLPYQLPADQVLELIASAIDSEPPADLRDRWEQRTRTIVTAAVFTDASMRATIKRLHGRCLPLHPVALALLWPLFRTKGAQNERSLFSFLTSSEALGFQAFLTNTPADAVDAPLYTVARLFDYITHALGHGIFRGDRAKRWATIDHALSRLDSEAPVGAAEIVKTIGMIDLLGAAAGLRADAPTISASISDASDVEDVLRYLSDRSIILYRRHQGAYVVWEGSDFDVEAAFADGKARVRRDPSIASRLMKVLQPRPLVAQRHYIETGTLRYFEVALAEATQADIERIAGSTTDADGRIVFLFPAPIQLSATDHDGQRPRVDATGKPLIFVTLTETGALLDDLEALETWEHVLSSAPDLSSDSVARREVLSRLLEAKSRLVAGLGARLGLAGFQLDPRAARWVWGDEVFEGSETWQLREWLSGHVLGTVYSKAPVLKNELLNRAALSSSASAARRELLERMLSHSHLARLGIEGYPPEYSMYASLLVQGGIHVERGGRYGWRTPDGHWRHTFDHIDLFIASSASGRRSIPELIDELKRPPFGLREGPIPVLLLAYLLIHPDEAALYEEGVLVPELRIEVMERLVRRPEDFSVRRHKLSRVQLKALAQLSASAELGSADSPEGSRLLLTVTRSLVGYVAALKPFARQTRRLEPTDTIAFRDAVLAAKDPATLLFDELPGILGVQSLNAGTATLFADRLRERLRVLGRAYPQLLDEIESQLRAVFSLAGLSDAAQHQLRVRAQKIQGLVSDPKLKTFVLEAARDGSGRDWREGLARAVRDGLPPSHWRDADVATFQVRLRELASDFLRIEELAAEAGRSAGLPILRVGLLEPGGSEIRKVMAVRNDQEPDLRRLLDRLSKVLREESDGSPDFAATQLEALARLTVDILRDQVGFTKEVP